MTFAFSGCPVIYSHNFLSTSSYPGHPTLSFPKPHLCGADFDLNGYSDSTTTLLSYLHTFSDIEIILRPRPPPPDGDFVAMGRRIAAEARVETLARIDQLQQEMLRSMNAEKMRLSRPIRFTVPQQIQQLVGREKSSGCIFRFEDMAEDLQHLVDQGLLGGAEERRRIGDDGLSILAALLRAWASFSNLNHLAALENPTDYYPRNRVS
ncbi:hypothetical protein BDY24DRAFT_190536 [Mrakia frigida]|uniref:uncharacterized protein n=1 Tax=Mrakia frigida TaxID=29902 RepID=UPI003FCC162B